MATKAFRRKTHPSDIGGEFIPIPARTLCLICHDYFDWFNVIGSDDPPHLVGLHSLAHPACPDVHKRLTLAHGRHLVHTNGEEVTT